MVLLQMFKIVVIKYEELNILNSSTRVMGLYSRLEVAITTGRETGEFTVSIRCLGQLKRLQEASIISKELSTLESPT